MLKRLGQSHFELLVGEYVDRREADVPLGEGGAGFTVRVLDGEVVVFRVEPGTAAEAAGVRPGWIVRSVGGRDPARLLAESPLSLSPARRTMEAWLIATRLVSGDPGSRVDYVFENGAGARVERRLELTELPGETAKLGFLPPFRTRLEWERMRTPGGAAVGVIRFNVWMLPAMAAFDAAVDSLRSADGIVIDLRGNVGGVAGMLIGIAGHFYEEKVSLGTLFGRAHRLDFNVNPRRVNRAGEPVAPFAGPVAVLIDRHSYSASEFFAGGLQGTGRARVFGEPSDGYALAASFTRLPGGDLLEHAVSDFVTAGGRRLEANGVVPDEVVPLTRDELVRGVDAPLEAAVRWIERERQNHE
jgi:carboxyl-terminal processing protease